MMKGIETSLVRPQERPAVQTDAAAHHFTESSLRESVIEHLFIGELLRSLWCCGIRDIEVLRPDVDRGGYDLVVEANGVVRHIQLKASHRLARRARFDIHRNLSMKPSAAVVWIRFDSETLDIGPFHFFGARPGQPIPPLGEKPVRSTRANRQGIKVIRKRHLSVEKARFVSFQTIDEIASVLFGNPSGPQPFAATHDEP
jgi:hypothetical protein